MHPEVAQLREEQEKVVTSCQEKIQHWEKVDDNYSALQERLSTLPDKLSYNIMVPFGPFAFMPGKLVHTNEITVLLGDNWFAKCSAKQAVGLAEHRKEHVRKTIDDLMKVMKNFESRVEFTEDLQKMSDAAGDTVDIREDLKSDFECKGKQRIAHKPHSKPKTSDLFEANFVNDSKSKDLLADKEVWARLEELEKQEQLLGELDSKSDTVIANGRDVSSSEEEKEEQKAHGLVGSGADSSFTPKSDWKLTPSSALISGPASNSPSLCPVNGSNSYHSKEDDSNDEEEENDEYEDGDKEKSPYASGVGENSVPTIYFSHTVEPKRVRINTGENTTLKFSEKKEAAKRKRKNTSSSHGAHELPTIKTPADIYRVFVDVVNGEYVPRKSILKSRSRENSVCRHQVAAGGCRPAYWPSSSLHTPFSHGRPSWLSHATTTALIVFSGYSWSALFFMFQTKYGLCCTSCDACGPCEKKLLKISNPVNGSVPSHLHFQGTLK
ncbi:LOW QUALITY PROTEIN: unconventional prefoldin RPB5 interactor 1-like [Thomomys bottae]